MAQEGQVAVGPNGQRAVYTNGKWVVVPQAPQPIAPADPRIQPDVANTQATTRRTNAQASVDEATAPAQIATAELPEGYRWIDPQNLALGIERIPGYVEKPSDASLARDEKNEGKAQKGQVIRGIMGEVIDLYKKDIKGNPATRLFGLTERFDGGPNGTDLIRSPTAERFTTTARGMLSLIRPLVAMGARDGDSDKEMLVFEAYIPKAGDSDITIESKLRNLERLLTGINPNETPTETAKKMDLRSTTPLVDEALGFDRDGNPYVPPADPARAAGVGATEGRVPLSDEFKGNLEQLKRGLYQGIVTPEQYAAERMRMDRAEFGDQAKDQSFTYMEEAYQMQTLFGQGARPEDVPAIDSATRELSQVDQFRNNVAASPFGTAAANFGDAGSLGAVSLLFGDQMRAAGDLNPRAALLGQIGGAIGGTAGLGGITRQAINLADSKAPQAFNLARRLLGGGGKSQFARNVGTDAAYGTIYGTNTGQSFEDAALASVVGSTGGNIAGKLIGKTVSGVPLSDAAQYLRSRNIPLTTGQTLGGWAKNAEDAMTSIPVVGDMINARRLEGLQAFNREAFSEAGKPIGFNPQRIGADGLSDLQAAQGRAYDEAVAGQVFPIDNAFNQDVSAALDAAKALPDDLRKNALLAYGNRVTPAQQGAAVYRLDSPSSLSTPLNPTPAQMQRLSRVEDVPLGRAKSFQTQMDWPRNAKGDFQPPLIEGYGDMPVAVRMNNGEYLIIDGNHRTVAALNSGQQTAKMRVIDAKDFDPGNAGLAPTRSGMLDLSDEDLLRELGGIDPAAPLPSGYATTGREAITGPQYQGIRSDLKGYRAQQDVQGPGFPEQYRDVITQGITALDNLVARQGGEDVVQGLNRANTSYRLGKIVQQASEAAKGGSGSGEVRTFLPSQLQGANQASGRKFPGINPLVELADQGQRVLPSRLPDSGTGRRLIQAGLGATALGAGAGETYATGDASNTAKGLGVISLLALGGTRGGQKALNTLLTERPDLVRKAAEELAQTRMYQRLGGIGGIFGSAGVPYALSTQQ